MNIALRKIATSVFVVIIMISLLSLATGCPSLPTTSSPIASLPAAEFAVNKSIVNPGDTVQFSDKSTGEITLWLWDFGDNTTSSEQNPSHIFTDNGNFSVTLKVSNKEGSGVSKMNISVLQSPVAGIEASKDEALAGESIQFIDKSTGDVASYYWDFGDGATTSEKSASHAYSSSGNFTVSLKVSNELSSDTKTVQIKVLEPLKADFFASSTMAKTLEKIQFTDNSTGEITSYLWDFGDLTISTTEQNPSHMYRRAGNFAVSLTVSNELGSDTKTVQVQVLSKARASFSTSITKAKAGEKIQFTDDSIGDIDTWLWDFGDGSTSTAKNPTHAYSEDGYYTVTLTVSNPVSTDTLMEKNLVTVASLNVGLIFCSDYNIKTSEYNLYPEAKYSHGELVALFIGVRDFGQKDVSGGKDIWVQLKSLKIYLPDMPAVLSYPEYTDISLVHETVKEPMALLYLTLPLMEIDKSYPVGEYRVEVVLLDNINGNMGIQSASFTVE